MWTMMNENDREKNQEAVTVGRQFLDVKPLPTSALTELGKVIQFDIHTDDVSTGLLFEHIELNPMLCVAQYRTFYKIHVNTTFAAEKIKEEKTQFYALCIFSSQGNLTIHVQNRPYGVSIQCIFSTDHGIQDIPSLLRFLNIKQDVHIENEKSMGLLAEFTIENTRPKNIDVFQYAALQSPIFSNLCLNDRRFSRFLSVNDTDKISRQNMSCYIYFHSPIVEKTTTEENYIYVGGWNRQRSRFGDLTAILTPEQQTPDSFRIHVKVTRSVNTQVVLKFYDMLPRLVSLYNTLLNNEMNLFRSYLSNYQPNYVSPKVGTKTIMSLSDTDPVLFPPLIYSRICQQPKPIVISEEQANQLPPERVLKFPPRHLKGFPPRYYTCNDEKNYPYPGFITFKRNVNHPFMIAPCCFKRNNLDKNRELTQSLMTTKKDAPSDKPIPVIFPPRNLYRIKSDKIIDQVGQLAQVPRPIEKFLSFLTSPLYEFSRIGMPSGWEKESILACLEFYHAVQTKRHFFRSQKELRHLLLQENLEITLQQNYDIGLDNVAEILQDSSQYIDPRRFYRLLERFFQVNLLILQREDDMVDMVRPYSYRSLEWYIRSNVPVVIIYQHYGGTTEATYNVGLPQCELIGYKDTQNILHTHIKTTSRVELFFQLAFASFFGNKLNTPTPMNKRQSVSSFLLSSIHSQWIDPIGKARLLFFTESQYPTIVQSPIAPLSLPLFSLSSLWIPPLQHVLDLFEHAQIRLSCVERHGDFLFLHTDAFLTHIMFLVRISKTTPLPFNVVEMETLPVYIHDLLYPRESKFETHLWNQRFSNILQDYIVIQFAKFLKEKDVNLIKTSQEEIVDLFLNEYVSYEQVYTIPESHTLSSLVHNNPSLFRHDRLRLPQCFSERIPFFIKWFMTTKYDELTILEKARELPSFYQRVCDFTPTPSHVIQLSLQELFPLKSSPYLSTPLQTLVLEQDNEDDIHYYFNVDETPKTEPYIILHTRNLLRATWIAKKYLKTGEIFFPKQSTPPSTGISEYFIKQSDDHVWKKKGGANPVVALYQKSETSMLILLPFHQQTSK
jgi:predicted Rdx family selenoprotein